MRQEDVDRAGGPSTATLRLIEREGAKAYRQRTYQQLDTALRWEPGSAWGILTKGTDPVPLERPEPRSRQIDVRDLTDEQIEAIQNLADALRGSQRNDA